MFNNCDYVHLHNHTSYSRFDGLQQMNDFVGTARKMGFPALAITDHGNVGGWIKFYKACKDKEIKGLDGKVILDTKGNPVAPIKPILGMEAYLARDHAARGMEQQKDGRKGNRHILLLAKNYEGYQNLCRLSQVAWTDGQAFGDPRIDLNQLATYSKGIICSSACLGSVININLLYDRYAQAKKAATLLKDIFGEDFYLASACHGIDAEAYIIPQQIKLANELGCLLVAENDVHFTRKEQAHSQEVLMAISTSKCIKDPKRIHFPYPEFYLKNAEEMAKIFGTMPKILTNTVAIAERVEDYLKIGGMRLPKFDVIEAQKAINLETVDEKITPAQLLEKIAWQGMVRLGWDKSPEHLAAYKMEINDLYVALNNNKMDFFTYFLVVWDIIRFARSKGIMTGGGRGSGYASVILRCLGITYGPDPLKFSLIWSRFLGFDDKYFLTDSDWGFDSEEGKDVVALQTDDLDEERIVEEDQGGVDRY